eukprot:GHVN01045854.1.p1 GENE.GHVN01045854.1~~GHVN01045854.1.p1  ORF type:complete len:444 (+),score=74.90 GHVN01045854.1:74-1405(+)
MMIDGRIHLFKARKIFSMFSSYMFCTCLPTLQQALSNQRPLFLRSGPSFGVCYPSKCFSTKAVVRTPSTSTRIVDVDLSTHTVVLIDANSLLHADYHAGTKASDKTDHKALRWRKKKAIHTFVIQIANLINQAAEDASASQRKTPSLKVYAVFDHPSERGPRFNTPSYKATRPATPEDLPDQIDSARKFCELSGIATLCVAGCEADDTIASLVKLYLSSHSNMSDSTTECEAPMGMNSPQPSSPNILILSDDKDMRQCLTHPSVKVVRVRQKWEVMDESDVENTQKVKPSQLSDWLALVGDKSDNIPGVRGIGPVKASSLLKLYPTVEDILANVETVHLTSKTSSKKDKIIRDQLRASAESLRHSLSLTKLDFDVPLPDEFKSPWCFELSAEESVEFLQNKHLWRAAERFSEAVKKLAMQNTGHTVEASTHTTQAQTGAQVES